MYCHATARVGRADIAKAYLPKSDLDLAIDKSGYVSLRYKCVITDVHRLTAIGGWLEETGWSSRLSPLDTRWVLTDLSNLHNEFVYFSFWLFLSFFICIFVGMSVLIFFTYFCIVCLFIPAPLYCLVHMFVGRSIWNTGSFLLFLSNAISTCDLQRCTLIYLKKFWLWA